MRRDPSCENLPRICCPSRERRRGELWAARHITGHGGALTLGFQPAAGAKKLASFWLFLMVLLMFQLAAGAKILLFLTVSNGDLH